MKNRVLLILLAVMLLLSVGFVSCGGEVVPEYSLTISSTEGGSVTTPGEGTFTYDEGKVVNLVAIPNEGYRFVSWTGDVGTIANVNTASTTITMNGDYSITATFAVKQYNLVIHGTEGGSVTAPGENAYTYDKGEVVSLVAVADEGYVFVNWTGDVSTIADVNAASTTITMNGGYSITANFAGAIRDWYDLDAIRNNLDGSYIMMNKLDSSTAGYGELASSTANDGKGWQPIGTIVVDQLSSGSAYPGHAFTGNLDGQGYELRDLFVDRSDEHGVALFSCVGEGVIQNLGMMEATVAGCSHVGSLVGCVFGGGTVGNCYCTASVSGTDYVGGLVGGNDGIVGDSYSNGSVTGAWGIGGLTGGNWGTVRSSYSSCGVTGAGEVGGLVGWNHLGTVSNSYSLGSVTAEESWVGGLVGMNHDSIVSNSYYSYDEVLINSRNIITIGALSNADFDQWLANDKSFDVNERLSQEGGYCLINDVNDFISLLAFGQDDALRFRLTNDLDLRNQPNFYIPYLAGEFDGNGHKISDLSFHSDFGGQVGLFGYLAAGGAVTGVSVENVNMLGGGIVGGLVGENDGAVSNSCSTGRVDGRSVGGLVGWVGSRGSTVSNSHYSYDDVLINGERVLTIGALSNEDFDQWLANDKSLDANESLARQDGYYLINDVSDFKQLLAFGQDSSLKFRLTNDLDLGDEPNFYIPYFAGEFDGNGRKIGNLSCHLSSVGQVGLFGYLGSSGKVSGVGVENVDITVTGHGYQQVGGLVGGSAGTVSNSYSTGCVTGSGDVGGLVGWNQGTVVNSYSTGSAASAGGVGGLVGRNVGTVSDSYSTGSVTGGNSIGGLVGQGGGTTSDSFWDAETSGQSTSHGGTGKTTAEMKSIATFSGAGWNIIAVVNPSTRNAAYIWNIVDGQTYPFLSWQA